MKAHQVLAAISRRSAGCGAVVGYAEGHDRGTFRWVRRNECASQRKLRRSLAEAPGIVVQVADARSADGDSHRSRRRTDARPWARVVEAPGIEPGAAPQRNPMRNVVLPHNPLFCVLKLVRAGAVSSHLVGSDRAGWRHDSGTRQRPTVSGSKRWPGHERRQPLPCGDEIPSIG